MRALRLDGAERAAGLAYAREWREANRSRFDEMDRRGLFSDSWMRWPVGAPVEEWPVTLKRDRPQ